MPLVHAFLLDFRFYPFTHLPVRGFPDMNKSGFHCLPECAHAYTSLQTPGLNSGPQICSTHSLKAARAVLNVGQIWTEFLQTPCSGYTKLRCGLGHLTEGPCLTLEWWDSAQSQWHEGLDAFLWFIREVDGKQRQRLSQSLRFAFPELPRTQNTYLSPHLPSFGEVSVF